MLETLQPSVAANLSTVTLNASCLPPTQALQGRKILQQGKAHESIVLQPAHMELHSHQLSVMLPEMK